TLGMIGVLLTAFASITTRPLMLLLFGALTVLSLWRKNLRVPQFIAMTDVMIVLSLLFVLSAPENPSDALARILTGLSSSGSTEEVTTVLTAPDFWGPSAWQTLAISETESL